MVCPGERSYFAQRLAASEDAFGVVRMQANPLAVGSGERRRLVPDPRRHPDAPEVVQQRRVPESRCLRLADVECGGGGVHDAGDPGRVPQQVHALQVHHVGEGEAHRLHLPPGGDPRRLGLGGERHGIDRRAGAIELALRRSAQRGFLVFERGGHGQRRAIPNGSLPAGHGDPPA